MPPAGLADIERARNDYSIGHSPCHLVESAIADEIHAIAIFYERHGFGP